MKPLRIALATSGVEQFRALQEACVQAGHLPVVYAYCRSMLPSGQTDDHALAAIHSLVPALPPGMDLVLPGTAEGLTPALAGYQLDLLVVHGFNWKLPTSVLALPRLGAVNVHPSLLPRYRGPAPVLQAIRNGDPQSGLTVHRMDENFDTGPILAQRGGIELGDAITRASCGSRPVRSWSRSSRPPGPGGSRRPRHRAGQTAASYAGFIEPEFRVIDWSRTAREVHHQVRMFAFIGRKSARWPARRPPGQGLSHSARAGPRDPGRLCGRAALDRRLLSVIMQLPRGRCMITAGVGRGVTSPRSAASARPPG